MIDEAQHAIERLQSQVAQHYEAEIALKLTMEMVANLVENWNEANTVNRRTLANGIFEYLVYDLDATQIVDFKLKPWIELLMQIKVTLGNENDPDDSGLNESGKLGVVWCTRRASAPPEYPAALLDPHACAREVLRRIYARIPPPPRPIDRSARDTEIYERFLKGDSTAVLARFYNLTPQRIRKIIQYAKRDNHKRNS